MLESDVIEMHEAAKILDSRDKLFILNSMDYPKMKDSNRKTLHKEIHSVAYPAGESEKMTTDQVANSLASAMGRI